MAKKFAVSIPDKGPLTYRWKGYSFEKGKPSKPVDNEADAEYLRNNGMHVRELGVAEQRAQASPHAAVKKAPVPAPAVTDDDEPDLVEEEGEPVAAGPTASEALESALPAPKKKPAIIGSKKPLGKPQTQGRTA